MDFLDQTIAVWQPHADHALTREDAREIAHNVVGFFSLLREWAEEERRSVAAAEHSPTAAPGLHSDAQSNPVLPPDGRSTGKLALPSV